MFQHACQIRFTIPTCISLRVVDFGRRQTPWSVGTKAYTQVETVPRTPCSSRSAFVLLVQVVVHRTPCSSRSAFVLLVQVVVHGTPCSSRSAFVLLVQVVVHWIPSFEVEANS